MVIYITSMVRKVNQYKRLIYGFNATFILISGSWGRAIDFDPLGQRLRGSWGSPREGRGLMVETLRKLGVLVRIVIKIILPRR